MARQARRGRRRLLPAEERLRLADAAQEGIPALADGVLPLLEVVAPGRKAPGRAHDRLREAVREAQGREQDPSGAVIDSQAVKGTGVGGPERGYDGAKRLSGRKRHLLLVDTGGLVLAARMSTPPAWTTGTAREGS